MHFPRAAVPGGGAGVAAYGAGGGGVPAATSLLAPPQAEASRLGDGGDDWRSSRFAFSREALGASSAAELTNPNPNPSPSPSPSPNPNRNPSPSPAQVRAPPASSLG